MNRREEELLFSLVPAIYREMDVAQGSPLQALLGVIQREFDALKGDIDGLYDNLFPETCDVWAVPFIGDLLGIRGLAGNPGAAGTLRALVGNTLAYRQRKGTPAILERAARDATGWGVRSVEFFDLISATQEMNHIRPGKGGTVNLRDEVALEHLDSAFETTSHTVNVRLPAPLGASGPDRVGMAGGTYNIPHLGIFVWRLVSYPMDLSQAFEVQPGCYTFDPRGLDTQLFNPPATNTETTRMFRECDLPVPLRRMSLSQELEELRQTLVDDGIPRLDYFGFPQVLQVAFADERAPVPVPAAEIEVMDLGNWQKPVEKTIKVAVDPVLGRLTVPDGSKPGQVWVSYSYGFSANIGGGPYARKRHGAALQEGIWRCNVASETILPGETNDTVKVYNTIDEAVAKWSKHGQHGVIRILDSGTYFMGGATADDPAAAPLSIQFDSNASLSIEAAEGRRPCLIGNLLLRSATTGGAMALSGLLVNGAIEIQGGLTLTVDDCTVIPTAADATASETQRRGAITSTQSAIVDNRAAPLGRVEVSNSIVGPIYIPAEDASLRVEDSIIDAGGAYAIAGAAGDEATNARGPTTVLARTTVLGQVSVVEIESASAVIFAGKVDVLRTETGYIRYSYVPEGSITPGRYHCMPDIALEGAETRADRSAILLRSRPAFTSTNYWDPGFGQLSLSCASEIKRKGGNGAEMGVFNRLDEPRRLVRLESVLGEYLRFGLSAGVTYVT